MAKEKLFQIGIKGLIENKNGQVLLFKAPGWAKNNTPPHWDIPGGRIQEGHSVLDTLSREIREEAGITKISHPIFFTSVISSHEIPLGNNKAAGLVLMVYKVQIPEKTKIVLSEEHIGVEWVDKKEAARRLSNKYPPEFTNLL
jgi:8-oxo-dGTP pyrophosphatase MutT (NUDIX family)